MWSKLLAITLCVLLGYSVASFQSSRAELNEEISDYQREILIAVRLLQEYSDNCATVKHSNFSPYVEHSVSRYALLVDKAEGFPYFMGESFTLDHQESVVGFEQQIEQMHKAVSLCE